MSVRPNLKRGSLPWIIFCDNCVEPIDGTRYCCSECLRFDLCPSCREKKGHPHPLYQETLHPQQIVDQLVKCPSSGQAIQLAFKLYAHRLAFGYRDPTLVASSSTAASSSQHHLIDPSLAPLPPYRWITFEETGKRVHDIGNGLRQLISPRSFVALCSHVQLPWYLADYACQIHSMIGPAISPTCSVDDIVHIVNSTKMKLVFASTSTLERVASAASSCPTLQYIVLLTDSTTLEEQNYPSIVDSRDTLRRLVSAKPVPSSSWFGKYLSAVPYLGSILTLSEELNDNLGAQLTDDEVQEWKNVVSSAARPAVLCLSDLEYLGRHVAEPEVVITKPEELESLLYTSGSTGVPKGAMFSGASWKSQLCPIYASITIEKCVSWTVSDRINDYRHLYYGSAVGIYNGDMSRIFEDLQSVRPHQLNATPALWNKIYAEFKAELDEELRKSGVNDGSNDQQAVSSSVLSPSNSGKQTVGKSNSKRIEDPRVEEIRKRVMKSFSTVLGGRVERIVTGGAPTSPEVIAFLWECFECRVAESYGTTECGGILSAGQFVKGLKWKLVPWETYTPEDKPNPRGELCVKRDNVMMSGYFGDEATTADAVDSDGFYHTGDIVELNHFKDGVTIVDRKKNIFKLAQGEFVAPAKIEKLLLDHCSFIKQVFVYGDTLKNSLVAIIVPHADLLIAHLKRHYMHLIIPDNLQSLYALAPSKSSLLAECARIGQNYRLRSFEIPADVHLSSVEFSVENGLMTPSEKPSRHALAKKFKAEIEEMYRQLDARRADAKNEVSKFLLDHFKTHPESTSSPNNVTESATSSEMADTAPTEEDMSQVQVGGDSLSAIKLRNLIQRNFSVSVPVQLLLEQNLSIEKVADIVSMATSHPAPSIAIEPSESSPMSYQSIIESSRCPSSWKPADSVGVESDIDASKVKAVFLTGATGFLGTSLLCELIRSTNAIVYCLVRDKSKSKAKSSGKVDAQVLASRIRESGLLDESLLQSMESWIYVRIKVVTGSLEEPKFGLGEDDWRQLCNTVSVVYHCGAQVNSVLPYARLAPTNVNGTRACLEMCTLGVSKLLVYVSTTSVLNLLRSADSSAISKSNAKMERPLPAMETISKEVFDESGGYSASKFVAEHLVWDAISKGFSCVVVRSGFIGSASTSGFANTNDFDNRLLAGIAQLKCAPFGSSTRLITCPVDFMTAVMLKMVEKRQESVGKCYHFEHNQSALTLALVVDSLASKGFSIERKSYSDWQMVVREKVTEENPLYPMIDEYFSAASFPARFPHLSTENFDSFIMSHMNGMKPETGAQFALKWIEWLLAHGHLSMTPEHSMEV